MEVREASFLHIYIHVHVFRMIGAMPLIPNQYIDTFPMMYFRKLVKIDRMTFAFL